QAARSGGASRAAATSISTIDRNTSRVEARAKLNSNAVRIPQIAARIGGNPTSSVVTMTTSGKSKSIRVNIDLQVGSSSAGRPRSMFFLASKWTDRKAPRKYSRAGITAIMMTSLYEIGRAHV